MTMRASPPRWSARRVLLDPPYLALVVTELRTPSAGSVQFQTVPVDPLLGPTRSAVYFGATVKLPLFSGPVP